jgi:hypothetical protein
MSSCPQNRDDWYDAMWWFAFSDQTRSHFAAMPHDGKLSAVRNVSVSYDFRGECGSNGVGLPSPNETGSTIMQLFIAAIFWISLGLTLYVAVVYPRLLSLLLRMRSEFAIRESTVVVDDADLPSVSVILPVFTDDRYLLDRLQNLLESKFPVDQMEVVVGCDPRVDLIADLIATVNDPRVRAVHYESPRGKAELINACLAEARNEIVLITDCGVHFDRKTIRRLAVGFHSPHVGGVCGTAPTGDASTLDRVGEHETRFGVSPDRNCTVAAYQAELVGTIPEDVQDVGLFVGLNVYRSGLEVTFDEGAVARRRCEITDVPGQHQSTINRCLNRMQEAGQLLRLSGCSLATLVVCSHWLRRIAPVFVTVSLIANAMLAADPLYLRLLLLHLFTYVALLIHLCLRKTKQQTFARRNPSEAGA